MQLVGVDFSSRPSARKPVVVAHGRLDGARLRLEAITPHPTLADFARWLAEPGPWVGGFDFPFGLPRELVEHLGWPLEWPALIAHYAAMEREQIRATFAAFCDARPAGAKFAHRACDTPAGSSPSMKWVNPPVAYMLHAGVPLLIEAGLHLPGHILEPPRALRARPPEGALPAWDGPAPGEGDPARVALEAYPGLLAREFVGRRSYKADERAKQTPERLIARKDIVDALEQGRSRLGVHIALTNAQRDALVADPTADRLDAVLCLVQAAWASTRPNFGLPEAVDPIEGWIVSA